MVQIGACCSPFLVSLILTDRHQHIRKPINKSITMPALKGPIWKKKASTLIFLGHWVPEVSWCHLWILENFLYFNYLFFLQLYLPLTPTLIPHKFFFSKSIFPRSIFFPFISMLIFFFVWWIYSCSENFSLYSKAFSWSFSPRLLHLIHYNIHVCIFLCISVLIWHKSPMLLLLLFCLHLLFCFLLLGQFV